MKTFLIIASVLIIGFGLYLIKSHQSNFLATPIGKTQLPIEKSLDKYTYEALRKRKLAGGEIVIGKVLKDSDKYESRLFFFTSDGRKVSGLINIPKSKGPFPVIIMIRGFVDTEVYATGTGTQHAAEVFAQNGFITLAPDFLGYGESDPSVKSPMEDRFLTYTTVLDLIDSVKSLNSVDVSKIGIWGHSNGGQIALSVLEISGGKYPTVLWVPVSKPFPYSILYYTDDVSDHGEALRKVVSDFEKDYDSEKYSLTNFFDWINGPIQLYQGGSDESVPQKWSDDLYKLLKDKKKEIEYFVYPEQDHNFSKASWSEIVEKNIEFYSKNFEK